MRSRILFLAAAAALGGAGAQACGDPIAVPAIAAVDTAQVLSDAVNIVILPAYRELDARAAVLDTAIRHLAAAPTDPNLAAGRDAWRATRTPWEMSEGFLFGPVETGGYDPALDAWPFNLVDAQALLAGSDPITPQLIASFDGAVKGFHAIEYLLFGHDGSKAAPALTAACRRRSSGTVERSRRRGKASAISPRRIARRSLRSSVRSE